MVTQTVAGQDAIHQVIEIPVYYEPVAKSGTFYVAPLNNHNYGGFCRFETDGAYREWTLILAKGTWRVYAGGIAHNGTFVFSVDGSTALTVTPGSTNTQGHIDLGTFTVDTSGRHTLRLARSGGTQISASLLTLIKES